MNVLDDLVGMIVSALMGIGLIPSGDLPGQNSAGSRDAQEIVSTGSIPERPAKRAAGKPKAAPQTATQARPVKTAMAQPRTERRVADLASTEENPAEPMFGVATVSGAGRTWPLYKSRPRPR